MKRINLAQLSTIGADWSWTFECARRAVAWSTDPALLERPAVERMWALASYAGERDASLCRAACALLWEGA